VRAEWRAASDEPTPAVKQFYVYILASASRRLHIGCTSDLARRVAQHRAGLGVAHTARYRFGALVHFEVTADARVAVRRERQLKGWLGARRVALIEATNPEWRDLARDWEVEPPAHPPPRRTRDPSLRSG
jgi:putative endonuclease